MILVLVGLATVFAPDWLGFRWLREKGWELRILQVLVGFLFLFQAVSILEKNRLRRRVHELYEGLNMLLYGKNYRRDREAIVILVNALRGKDEDVRNKAWQNLKRLTGKDFALDHEVWSTWWKANEKHFATKARRPEPRGEEKGGEEE
ncbi:MAG: hypothetical protein ABFS86_01850 [Planctomycetota bacterium]